MSFDPHSTLRPLRQRADDLASLRAGASAPGAVVRVARGVETTLRRLLRDDAVAPLELRLRALSADDLSLSDLLAALRRREHLPVELAAAVHDLAAAADRIAGGAEPDARDGPLALSVADALDAHVRALPRAPLADPAVPAPEPADAPEPGRGIRSVPPVRRRLPWGTFAAVAALVVLLVLAVRLRAGEDDALRAGEAAYAAGRVDEAERAFAEHVRAAPDEPLARVYLARIYRESGRRDQAAAQLQAGLRAAPRDPGLHTELGWLLLDGGRAREAAERFRIALRHDETSLRAWGGLVRALRESGQHAAAERALARAPADLRALLRTAPSSP